MADPPVADPAAAADPERQHFYRAPWTPERVAFLRAWWPHFGTAPIADELGLTYQQIQSKVNRLRLRLLPRTERLCIACRTHYQAASRRSLLCRTCYLAHRQQQRRQQTRALEEWIAGILREAGRRSREPCDLTVADLVALWHQQGARCFYSARPLRVPAYGQGTRPDSPSLDRIDPARGYQVGNVVWALWACNAGKHTLSIEAYIRVCAQVAHQHAADRRILPDIQDEP